MKRFFLRGLSALLPTVLTLWVVVALWNVVLDYVARPMTTAIHWTLTSNRAGKSLLERITPVRIYDPSHASAKLRLEEPGAYPRLLKEAEAGSGFFLDLSLIDGQALEQDLQHAIPPALGFAVGIVGVYFLGLLLGGYVGRLLLGLLERSLRSIPFVKKIYPYTKQIVDFFFGQTSRSRDFHAVVAVPYPHPGVYSLGFVTGDGLRTLNEKKADTFVTVFMPSSPTPISGFTIFVPIDQVIPMNLSVDDTFRLMISGGVIVPQSEVPVRPTQFPGLQQKSKPAKPVAGP